MSNPEQPSAATLAHYVHQPELQAAVTLQLWGKETGLEMDLASLVNTLSEQIKAAASDDLTRTKAMLTAQAITLDVIFNTLARKALNTQSKDLRETYLRLGLRAQNQCRSTLETLVGVKAPRALSIRQANIAHGPQQVNNQACAEPVHKIPAKPPENELMEQQDEQRLDPGTAGATTDADLSLAAVGAQYRTPGTPEGKRRSSQNAFSGAEREILQAMMRALKAQHQALQRGTE